MRPFSVRMHERAGLVQAEDLVGALVVARATWPDEQILSVIEVEQTTCDYIDFRGHWRCVLPPGHRYIRHRPTAEPRSRQKPPKRPFVKLTPEERAPRPTATRPGEVRLCECGNPSLNQKPGRASLACQRCRNIEESWTHHGDHVRGPQAHPTPPSKYKVNFNPSARLLPQLDSRTIHSGLAKVIREMNRLKPFTTM